MTFDTKYINGDIVASVNGKSCTAEELVSRFDNHEDGLMKSVIIGTVNTLVRRGMLRESKRGILSCTAAGRKYIREHGYFD